MKSLSLDLRQRIVDALDTGATQQSIADRFAVSRSSVERLAAKKREGQNLQPGVSTGRRPLVPNEKLDTFKEVVQSQKDPTAGEIAKAWQEKGEKVISLSTATRALHRMGFSFKKNAK